MVCPVPSKRALGVSYPIRAVDFFAEERLNAGKDVIRLNVGDPAKYDFKVPLHVVNAAREALKSKNFYAPSAGIDEAREAVSGYYKVPVKRVFMTIGVSEGIDTAMNALLDRGDSVFLPKPCYPLYTALCQKMEARAVFYDHDAENNWAPVLPQVKAKAIVVISPNNPTGAVYSKKMLKEMVDVAAKGKMTIIADEIYDGLVFEGSHTSLAKVVKDEVPLISLNGMSKNFFAPGWRIGWMVLKNCESSIFLKAMRNLLEADLCAPTPMQFAVKSALEGSRKHVRVAVKKLRQRRDVVWKRLNGMGLECNKPMGAFYAFSQIPTQDDESFVHDLCRKTGVLCVHGSGFGKRGFMRVVFLPKEEVLHEAMDRIERFLK